MNILVTNDDGINSEALKVLVEELSFVGDVYVVAPDRERSGNSHHITLGQKIRFEEKEIPYSKKAYALWGTPCDCTHCGILYFFKNKIDLVVSGINLGPNQSTDISYSGTCAAAREAFIYGIPSIATSLASKLFKYNEDTDYRTAAKITKDLIPFYMKDPSRSQYYLNVNIPDVPYNQIKGIKVTKPSAKYRFNEEYAMEEEFGVKYIKDVGFEKIIDCDQNNLGIDIIATNNNYVSISPLCNNHNNDEIFDEFKERWNKRCQKDC